jgi:hypothetical protein
MTSLRRINAVHKLESKNRFIAESAAGAEEDFTKIRQRLHKPRAAFRACQHCYARAAR